MAATNDSQGFQRGRYGRLTTHDSKPPFVRPRSQDSWRCTKVGGSQRVNPGPPGGDGDQLRPRSLRASRQDIGSVPAGDGDVAPDRLRAPNGAARSSIARNWVPARSTAARHRLTAVGDPGTWWPPASARCAFAGATSRSLRASTACLSRDLPGKRARPVLSSGAATRLRYPASAGSPSRSTAACSAACFGSLDGLTTTFEDWVKLWTDADLAANPAVVARYAAPSAIERAFADARNVLGADEARNRVKRAAERTVPFALLTHASSSCGAPIRPRPGRPRPLARRSALVHHQVRARLRRHAHQAPSDHDRRRFSAGRPASPQTNKSALCSQRGTPPWHNYETSVPRHP